MRDWEPDLVQTMAAVVSERNRRADWTTAHELAAVTADHLGVIASGQRYRAPLKRLPRPGDAEPVKTVGWAGFASMLASGAAA